MFRHGPEIRRPIYTTNVAEGLNRQVRKATKTKGAFTSEDALEKLIYLTLGHILEKWDKPIFAWNIIFSQPPDSFQRTNSAVPEPMTGLFPPPLKKNFWRVLF